MSRSGELLLGAKSAAPITVRCSPARSCPATAARTMNQHCLRGKKVYPRTQLCTQVIGTVCNVLGSRSIGGYDSGRSAARRSALAKRVYVKRILSTNPNAIDYLFLQHHVCVIKKIHALHACKTPAAVMFFRPSPSCAEHADLPARAPSAPSAPRRRARAVAIAVPVGVSGLRQGEHQTGVG